LRISSACRARCGFVDFDVAAFDFVDFDFAEFDLDFRELRGLAMASYFHCGGPF
jgi:hypothetical protein